MRIDAAHIKQSVLGHWLTTLLGLSGAAYLIFEGTPDPLALPWPELRTRILKAFFIAGWGALSRVARAKNVVVEGKN
jgi:hypothetical protein